MKFVNLFSIATATVLALHMTGCASMVSGSTKRLAVKTDPTGARVTVYNLNHPVYDKVTPKVAVMYTPCLIPLRTGAHHSTERYFVTIEKAGRKTMGFEVHSTINGWYFGNLDPLLLPLFPITMGLIDPASGAMWTIEPRTAGHVYEVQDLSKIPDENVDAPIIEMQPAL